MLTLRTPAGSPRGSRFRDCRLKALEIVLDREQEAFPGLGQRQFPGAAMEKPDAEITLQYGDVPADRRGRQREPPRGCGKSSRLGATCKGLKIGECFQCQDLQRMLVSYSLNYRLIVSQ
jgi:hypothetical protein